MRRSNIILIGVTTIIAIIMVACSGNDCPLNNTVTCNYYFYDAEGNAVSYTDPFDVKILLPGFKTQYTYKKSGYQTITSEKQDSSLINDGYTETIREIRRDSILVNKTSSRSYVELPMSYFYNADTLIFDYSTISKNDTIIVEKYSYEHIELPECGAHFFHNLKSVKSTDAAIDHIEISNPLVDFEGNENIKIYFNGIAE